MIWNPAPARSRPRLEHTRFRPKKVRKFLTADDTSSRYLSTPFVVPSATSAVLSPFRHNGGATPRDARARVSPILDLHAADLNYPACSSSPRPPARWRRRRASFSSSDPPPPPPPTRPPPIQPRAAARAERRRRDRRPYRRPPPPSPIPIIRRRWWTDVRRGACARGGGGGGVGEKARRVTTPPTAGRSRNAAGRDIGRQRGDVSGSVGRNDDTMMMDFCSS